MRGFTQKVWKKGDGTRVSGVTQSTQTDTNCQETLTSGTIGKKSPFVKESLRFVPLVQMESSSVHWYTICKLHLIASREPCVSDLSIGTISSNRFHWKSS